MRKAILFLWFTLLSSAVVATELRRVRIQLNWLPEPEFGGIYEAERAGHFKNSGLAVEILKGGPDVPAVQMAAAGRVEFAIAAADEVVALREKGADVVALFATYQTSPQAIMTPTSRKAGSIKELLAEGGTLIAQPGLAYLKWLRARYDTSAVKVVPYGSGAMAQYLDRKAGKVAMQCFAFAEPITARRMGVDSKVFLIAETTFNPYTAVVITSGAWLRANRETCRAFVNALRAGWRGYLDDPKPANEIMARLNTSMDLATFAEAAAAQAELIENADTRARGLGSMTEARWSRLITQLLELGIIETPIPTHDCFVDLST